MSNSNPTELLNRLDAVQEVSRDKQIEQESKILDEIEESIVSSHTPDGTGSVKYAHQVNDVIKALAENPVIINIENGIPLDMVTNSWNFIHIVAIKANEAGVHSDGLGDIASAVNYRRSRR